MTRLSAFLFLAVALSACGTSREAAPPMTAPVATVIDTMAAPMIVDPVRLPTAEASPYDTVRAGRFDNGRMFTLDDAPRDYLRQTYGFSPDQAWFDRARLGALRFATYCSASFVSPTGLILTNHHCARESVTAVGLAAGRDFNEEGFYAANRAGEARVPELFVEQLVEIVDVTDRVSGDATGADAAARTAARQAAIEAIQTEMTDARGEGFRTQVVTFYSGGQYKAYVYRRYDDVRLVFAPETALGYFGGDPDNFTYPRYSLDFALFRAYGPDGQPLATPDHFAFEPEGTDPGDLVFVLGNPGSTTRLQTVAQLEYRRDVTEPALLAYLTSREAVYGEFLAANPDDPRSPELTDTWFSLGNGRKAYGGRVSGLRDPYIIARRRAAEREFLAALAANPAAQAQYGTVVDRIAANREAMRASANQERAFMGLSPASPYNGTALSRGFLVALGRASAESFAGVEDQPESIQVGLIAARYQDLLTHLGASDPTVRALLGGRTPRAAAEAVVAGTRLATESEAVAAAGGDLASDPAVQAATTLLGALRAFSATAQASGAELGELSTQLARARFDLYGTSIPPDATFTLRLTDGVVRGYDYNGTVAPPYTTFYGMYDRYESHCVATGRADDAACPWTLPPRWRDARSRLNLATPYNFVSTTDIIGGNSGSPVVDRNLRVVGIAFDGNIDGLPGNYIFDDRVNRTVSLDSRAMIEVLRSVYNMQWLLPEMGVR